MNLQELIVRNPNRHIRCLTARMPVNIRKRLLHDSENRNLHMGCKSTELRSKLHFYLHIATLREAVGQRLNRRQESYFVKKGRMQEVGDCA